MQERQSIIVGWVLAAVLTALPFGLVATGVLQAPTIFWVIGVAAVLQILVHLHFFLGIGLKSGKRDRTGALIFACVLLFIMVGGTLWVMGNLNYRMM